MVSCDNSTNNEMEEPSARNSFVCKCNLPNCVPTHKLKYVQPSRPASFKPIRSYVRPMVKMDADTVYKTSFLNMDPCMIKICRPPAILPTNQLRTNTENISKDTITKLSFPGYYNCEKRQPILPNPPSLLGSGPMMSLTTQKHDYIFKSTNKRTPILPRSNLQRACGAMERETIQKLSFPKPIGVGPPKSFKPIVYYQRPEIKMESDTVNKLSFLPLYISKRETPVWAKKPCYQKPSLAMTKDTTYKLSFIPNRGGQYRPKMVTPMNNLSTNKCSQIDPHTIYKESYICDFMPQRTIPILPKPNLSIPCGERINPKTIYELSFPIYCSYEKRKPILPNPPTLLGKGPIQTLTTHKHDFLCKPITKLEPIRPKNSITISKCPLDKDTTMKLSYQCNEKENYKMLKSFKPIYQYQKPEVAMDSLTTQKLSFLPVNIPPKENHPWAQKAKFKTPTEKMESATTQRLSYIAPGQYVDDHDCPCQENELELYSTNAPKAAIY